MIGGVMQGKGYELTGIGNFERRKVDENVSSKAVIGHGRIDDQAKVADHQVTT